MRNGMLLCDYYDALEFAAHGIPPAHEYVPEFKARAARASFGDL